MKKEAKDKLFKIFNLKKTISTEIDDIALKK